MMKHHTYIDYIYKVLRLIMLGGLVFVAQPVLAAVGLDAIVATVNDGAITQSQLTAQTKLTIQQLEETHTPIPPLAELRRKVLKQLIDNQLQLQAAKKMGIVVDDAMVNQTIGQIAEQNSITVPQLQAKLREEHMNYDEYRKTIREQITLNQLQQHTVATRVTVSNQEITDFLNTHGKDLQALAAPHQNPNAIYHLVVVLAPVAEGATPEQVTKGKEAAQQALTRMSAGEDVQTLVISPLGISADLQQTDLGWRNLNQLPELYDSYLKNIKPGAVVGPIRTPNGFHVIKLVEARGIAVGPAILPGAVQTHVRHILLKTTPLENDAQVKTRLERLRASILAGTSFAEAASANSQDPGSVSKGGDLGWTMSGTLDPTFEATMSQMKIGQISVPFKSQFGWHILQVLERKAVPKSEGVQREQARQLIFQRKFKVELERWLQTLRKSGYVREFN